MFEPQHETSSEEDVDSDTAQDQPETETVESDVRSRFGMRLIAKFNAPINVKPLGGGGGAKAGDLN